MKKIIATILVLILALGMAFPALADSSDVYDLCVAEFEAHKPATAYSGIKAIIRSYVDSRGRLIILSRLNVTIPPDAGFVSKILKSAGMVTEIQRREDLNKLAVTSPAVDGAVLFKYSSTGGVSLVGIYANGYQFYIKSGFVVMETYSASYWQKVGVIG